MHQSANNMLVRLAGRAALIAVLMAVFGLAGCGRKAGLDAPPMAAAGDQQAGSSGTAPATGPDGKPTAANTATTTDKRHTALDWLLN